MLQYINFQFFFQFSNTIPSLCLPGGGYCFIILQSPWQMAKVINLLEIYIFRENILVYEEYIFIEAQKQKLFIGAWQKQKLFTGAWQKHKLLTGAWQKKILVSRIWCSRNCFPGAWQKQKLHSRIWQKQKLHSRIWQKQKLLTVTWQKQKLFIGT